MPSYYETMKFIQKAHSGQSDKAGVPYWTHPCRVAMYYQELFPDATEEELNAALLHDILEDTAYTKSELLEMGYSEKTIDIIVLVTKEPKPRKYTYLQWIEMIANSRNLSAIRVKLADLKDNGDPVRIAQLPYEDRDIIYRYSEARKILWDALKR